MKPSLHLFDDAVAQGWQPFSLTRPAGELLFGALLLRERMERFWGTHCEAYHTSEHLVGFSEDGSPPVQPLATRGEAPLTLLLSSRLLLTGSPPILPAEPATLTVGGEVAGWSLPEGSDLPSPEELLRPRARPGSLSVALEGRWLEAPWNLMAGSGNQLREDIPTFFEAGPSAVPEGTEVIGEGRLSLGTGVEIEPGCVFDLREGPIRLDDGVSVRAHTRLAGPAYVGTRSSLLGGVLSEVTIGPRCKVRGEVESTVILGYTNKAHDGFLGHSYLGRWVNLGAFTTNSDLKNNYGPVRVGGPAGPVETGLLKVGCFLGDHVKTGIGTLLNTGTVVGAGSNLFGGRMPPTYVPPFSWGSGSELAEYRLDRFLEVARRVMARRDKELDADSERVLRRAWEVSRPKGSGPA